MIAQSANELIVVDYSCPDRSGEFVTSQCPSARVVQVPDQRHFSNWKARNAGAAVATSELLLFVDADTILAPGAIGEIEKHLPVNAYGFFDRQASAASAAGGSALAANQLKGFHAIPRDAFRSVGGYDEVLEGYASGADTDLEERLGMLGLSRHRLDAAIVDTVIPHDRPSRTRNHAEPVRISYCAGLLYRAAKTVMLRGRAEPDLPLATRKAVYEAALKAAHAVGRDKDRVVLDVRLAQEPVSMPGQLGYRSALQSVSVRVELSLKDKLKEIPE